jgi:hypothetical protein
MSTNNSLGKENEHGASNGNRTSVNVAARSSLGNLARSSSHYYNNMLATFFLDGGCSLFNRWRWFDFRRSVCPVAPP